MSKLIRTNNLLDSITGLSLPPTGNLPVDKCLLLMWEVNSGLKSEDKAIEETRDEYKRKESQLERVKNEATVLHYFLFIKWC